MTRISRVAGRAAGVLIVLAALSGLAACTPADPPLTAVRAINGNPVVLLAGCADFQIDSFTVYPESGNVTVSADGPERTVERTGSVVPESMPLFGDPPTGWTVADGQLTALAADRSYGLIADDGGHGTATISFTAADLAALGPDEVLVGKTPSSHEKVTEREFRKRAKDAC